MVPVIALIDNEEGDAVKTPPVVPVKVTISKLEDWQNGVLYEIVALGGVAALANEYKLNNKKLKSNFIFIRN